ncbi:PAS domain S-box protein [Billgrantia ethanolica]|uniref:PAS domain S-box protein n=1 Tax=Billgrantia ethanolica TaxID=2733486 RepID=A0ABS9A0R0_9GAMM|nr:PAS domain-containing protein [Halomonas ethanolica]MCE8002412.1 PAS domain S-box protein [Halomonas ethanolica]
MAAHFTPLHRLWHAAENLLGLGRKARPGDKRFRALLEELPNIAVQGYDRDRRVIYWNEESELLYGYCTDEAVGRRLEELIIPDAMKADVVRLHSAWLYEGRSIPSGRLVLQDKQGRQVPVYSYHVMFDEFTDNPVMFCVDVRLDATPETSSNGFSSPLANTESQPQ